ncbi:NAD-P-binding protein [Acaromyces ingoldii]|uniref:NAD-P-binding protein n=1 Tax=Acaromyces ingoldii TaxID=215250 RepID=A0A316YTC4_9BASI|nr:NAD-P-binding protein [Acaromyces ingoldii]PWN91273.1 NAD-P-binding protein [Acaromyces ingoldii]
MAPSQLDATSPIRVGILGAGEVSQVVHLPTLAYLSQSYKVTAICDVSREAVAHAQAKFHIAFGCHDSAELCAREDVDLVVVASADEFHAIHAVQAADKGKHVLIEKPMTLTREDARLVEEARKRNGVHISVGYMRRYTSVWARFLDLVADSGPIQYAVVRDLGGPNSTFVSQSGTDPKYFTDIAPQDVEAKRSETQRIARTAPGKTRSKDARLHKIFRLLGSLGSHDLSCMRHVFGGLPKECRAAFASQSGDFIAAQFVYGQEGEDDFAVNYETGIHAIGLFDAFIEVFCRDRIVKIKYDTPYVKGLPITITVRENSGVDGRGFDEKVIRPTFVDAYTAEFLRLEKALRAGAKVTEEHPSDAVKDLDVFDMILDKL